MATKEHYLKRAADLGIKNANQLSWNELRSSVAEAEKGAQAKPKSGKIVTVEKSGDLLGLFTVKNKREVLKGGYVDKKTFDKVQKAIKDKDISAALATGVIRKRGIVARLME